MIRTICTLAFLAVAVPAFAAPLTLHKQYEAVGTNPDGSQYTGTVTVNVISDVTYTIQWTIAGSVIKGFGMRNEDTLAATYTLDGAPGLVIYKVGGDGVLSGLWAVRGQNGAGTERLTPHD